MRSTIIQPKKIKLGDKKNILPGPEPLLPKDKRIIRVSEPSLGLRELKYVEDCLKTKWISSQGSYIYKFEETFARAVNARFGVSVSSGTTALHLAFYVLGLGRGDEVIIPTFTMIAAANMLYHLGVKSVFVDADPATWTINVAEIEKKITPRTKAIVAIHIYGHPCDMDAIQKIAKKHNLWVIEDAAEAHGAEYKGRKIGSLGDIACFSFYGNKIITTGEGGMLTTNNEEIARKARIIRDHGFSETARFFHEYAAFNYRMTNMQAAVGVGQMERFDNLVNWRIKNASLYNKLLSEIPGIQIPPKAPWAKNVYWVYGILVHDNFGISRDRLRQKLAMAGIETRTFFVPSHLQPVFYNSRRKEKFPVSEKLCQKGLYLPQSSCIKAKDIKFIASTIRNIYKKHHES